MTTVQHRPTSRVSFDDVPSWVWIAIAAVLAVGMGLAIGYTIADRGTSEESTAVEDYEDGSEATPMHMATETPVTVNYLGYSGELYPATAGVVSNDMAVDTPMHIVTSDPVTTQYFGNSGELYPELVLPAAALGLEYDHEVTPIHVSSADDWVKAEYVGMSGALSIEH